MSDYFFNTVILEGETFSIGTWGNQEDPETNKKHKGAWLNLDSYTSYMIIQTQEIKHEERKNHCMDGRDHFNRYGNCQHRYRFYIRFGACTAGIRKATVRFVLVDRTGCGLYCGFSVVLVASVFGIVFGALRLKRLYSRERKDK